MFCCRRLPCSIRQRPIVINFFSPARTTSSVNHSRLLSEFRTPVDESTLLLTFSQDVEELSRFIDKSNHLVAITGAGVSTSSGIPDYRGRNGSYRKGHQPITQLEFLTVEERRKRYWARSMIGWHRVAEAFPNPTHYALAKLEVMGKLKSLITQNVDRLHQRAGSQQVIDLHGRIDQVTCMYCDEKIPRKDMQDMLTTLNHEFSELIQSKLREGNQEEKLRADGDIDLELEDYSEFVVPDCQSCGAMLKPDVVLFGDNVPIAKVNSIYEEIDRSDGLLVVGTSLEVFSAYRFVDRANKRQIPIAIINDSETRAERQKLAMIRYRSYQNCSLLLPAVIDQLLLGRSQ